MGDPLEEMLGQKVVLDTLTPIVYLGTLSALSEHAIVLVDADIHDCRDGTANKEGYVADAVSDGVAANRRRIVVMRSVVISASLLADVIDSMPDGFAE